MRPFHLIFLFPILCCACCAPKTTGAEATPDIPENPDQPPVIRLYKGSCYGQCPAYTLELFRNGRVVMTPRRFVPVDTTMVATWPVEEIIRQFDSAGLEILEDEYMAPIADIPSFRLKYLDKEIRWNGKQPAVLQNLVALLDRYTVAEGWLEAERAFTAKADYLIEKELIIQLKPDTDMAIWLDTYMDVGLFVIREIVKGGEYILVGYDQNVVDPDVLLKRVLEDDRVVLASFNKELDQRD
ncbi:MAG: DUF6438 domain-containing protein [Saprospiraceae bacterium]|nr:DUF6438 domain-containing protein [Saprospiraceae bacterium]